MMDHTDTVRACISRDDLDVIAQAAVFRLQLRAPEAERLARIREVIAAASALSSALAEQVQRASILSESTRATGELVDETAAVYDALSRYAAVVASVAAEFRPLVRSTRLPPADMLLPYPPAAPSHDARA